MDRIFTDFHRIDVSILRTVRHSFPMTLFLRIINNRYASDRQNDSKTKGFGYGRVSNAPIESFFKIIKHSILRHQTNNRPAEFLLKMYETTAARLIAKEHNIEQTGSKKRRSKKKQIDSTILTEKWKTSGTRVSNRSMYFGKFIKTLLTATDIRMRLREKLE